MGTTDGEAIQICLCPHCMGEAWGGAWGLMSSEFNLESNNVGNRDTVAYCALLCSTLCCVNLLCVVWTREDHYCVNSCRWGNFIH